MKKNRIVLLGILLSCASLSLVACGAEENVNESLDSVTFVLDWTPNTNHTGLYVAKELGFFQEEGIEVDIKQPPEDGATSLVATGRADFGVDFQDYLAPAFENSMPITAVAAVVQHNNSGIMSLKSKNIKTPKDLEGKTYATPNLQIETAMMEYIVAKDGGSYDNVIKVPSTVTDVVSALNTNIDAVWEYYSWEGISAKLNGLDTNFMYFKDIEPAFDYYTPVIIANNAFLNNKPDLARRFLKALSKGYEYAVSEPSESADILLKSAPELDYEIVHESQEYLTSEYISDAAQWGYIDPSRWNNYYNWLYENDLTVKLPENGGFTNEYLPNTP